MLPAYEMVLKASHTFNLLDARGAISVTERAAYIGRVRALARAVAAGLLRIARAARLPDGEAQCMEATLLVELLTEELPPKSLRRLSRGFRAARCSADLASAQLVARPAPPPGPSPRRAASRC